MSEGSSWSREGRPLEKCFAVVSACLMILVAFQVLCSGAQAGSPDQSSVLPLSDGTAFPSEESPAGNVDAAAIIGDLPPGTVESFSDGDFMMISSPEEPIVPRNYMTSERNCIFYWTANGTFSFNQSTPWKASLISLNGGRVVEESFFTIEFEGRLLEVANASVTVASRNLLRVDCLLSDPVDGMVTAKIETVYSFPDGLETKITASVKSLSIDYRDWRAVWVVTPPRDSLIPAEGFESGSALLRSFIGQIVPTSDFSVTLDVEDEDLLVDWSDACSGDLRIGVNDDGNPIPDARIEILFETGRTVIDPTLVCASSNTDPLDVSCQRKVFWYGGYYWLFYNSGTAICFRNSADGLAWSSENAMPECTTPRSGVGFDVESRNGLIGVAWLDTSLYVQFKKGVILGNKIVWSARETLCPYIPQLMTPYDWPMSVAIGTDGSFYVNYGFRYREGGDYVDNHWVERSFTGEPGTFFVEAAWEGMVNPSTQYWFSLLPIANGNIALLGTSYLPGSADNTKVSIRYSTVQYWTTPLVKDIGLSSGSSPYYKDQNISAVASLNGTVHIAYKATDGNIKCTRIYPGGSSTITTIAAGLYYPTICLDANSVLHLFYVVSGTQQTIYHHQKPEFSGTWSSATLIYTGPSGQKIRGLTSCMNPAGVCSLAWAEDTGSTRNVKYASIPLPFGTPGAPSDPWNRDGLSPYGTYFQMNNDYVSPGSGLMTLVQRDIAIEGRGEVELGISRIYQQPKYFWSSNNTPYGNRPFPFCNLGQHWSLDLPWIDSYYVNMANGQRFMIQWGNEGKINEFVNRDGICFVLRDVVKGANSYKELVSSDGLFCKFERNNPYKLLMMSDLRNYNPASSTYTTPYNCVNFTYSGSTLTSMTESGLGRSITFTYTSGLLTRITRQDGKYTTLAYTSYGGKSYLTSTTDVKNRVTSFGYNSSASYCLGTITYPTNGRVELTFAQDSTPATEMKTWLATRETVKNATSGALIRQTNFDYKIVNGRVTFCKVSNYNETGSFQGSNENIFQSSLKSSAEIVRNATGVQMQKKVTWYTIYGAPARTDTYLGDSQVVNASEYVGYDDWGNPVYKRDALGQESFSSFANTSLRNAFQGNDVLTRTGSGSLLHDSFDDWEFSDWPRDVSRGTVELDGSANPPKAPSIKLSRTSTSAGNAHTEHSIATQSSNFYIQTSYMTGNAVPNYILAMAGTEIRTFFSSDGGNFRYYTGSSWINVVPCNSNTWYDVGFYIRYSNSTYDIYVDGILAKWGATLTGSGNIDKIRFKAGYSGSAVTTLWFDDVRIYKSLTVTLSGLNSKYSVELYDSRNNLIDRSSSGTLGIPALPLFAPPGYIRLLAKGNYSYAAPMGDVWGGDSYALIERFHRSNFVKTSRGFAPPAVTINDEAKPAGSTEVWSSFNGQKDLIWVDDAVTGLDYSVSGTKHHESLYNPSCWYDVNHWHGFTGATTGLSVSPTDTILQYAWLTEGKMPAEIMVQYYVAGQWRRAFWGPLTTSIVSLPSQYAPSLSVYCGPMPQTTGQWLQLAVKASTLGVTATSTITGIIYGLYGGTAKWDYSSKASTGGVVVNGLSSGMTVKMTLDNGTVLTATTGGTSLTIDLNANMVRALPVGATFEVLGSGNSILYQSPTVPEVYSGDVFQYSASSFYLNQIKDGMHSRQVGSFAYQDAAKTVSMESYQRYDFEGAIVETKSKLGSGWVYAQVGYDQFGNVLWSADETGRRVVNEFSYSNKYTYPISKKEGDRTDVLEFDTSWTSYKWSSSTPDWLVAAYSSTRAYSPTHSFQISFQSAPSGYDTGGAEMYKEFKTNHIYSVSVRMYAETYSHNKNAQELMDSGIRMALYNSAGTNYATYYYWLACWSGTSDNRTTSDPNVKVVWGKPTLGTWLSIVRYPDSDWSIDWSACDKVRFSLYTVSSWAYGDQLKLFFDDFSFNDLGTTKTTYAYDINNGRVLSMTDACGHTVSQRYDELGRIIRTNNSDGTYLEMQYDDTNNKVTSFDELRQKTISYFDRIGRMIKEERYGVYTTVYSSIRISYTWQDQEASVRDELNRVTKYTYDYMGRLISVRNPDNAVSSTAYDDKNKLVTVSDEMGHKKVSVLDLLGRLNETREYYTSSSFYATRIAYNAAGHILTVRQANGEVTRMSYDSLGRTASIRYPDSKIESYAYDEAGRLVTLTTRSSSTVNNAYDAAGNIIRVIASSGTICTKYDAEGKVIERTNSLGNISYHYNNRDLVWRMVQKVSGTSYFFTYTYDAVGKPIYVDYPDARRITYLYDRYNRMVDVKIGNTKLLNVTYNLDDSVATKKYCNSNSSVSYTYNSRGWVTNVQGKNASSNVIMNLNYNYYADGNVMSIKDTVGSAGNEYYWYDNLDRLTKAMANSTFGTIMYGYSSVGNRIWKNEGTNISYSYNTYNQIESDGTWAYDQDARGNTAWKNSTTTRYNYIFNAYDQMTEVKKQVYSGGWGPWTTLAQYYYDANGARAKTVEGATTMTWIYSGHDPIYQIGSDGKGYKYIYLGGRLELRIYDATEKYAYLSDALGSTRKVLSNGLASTPTFTAVTYKPFGIVYSTTGSEKVTFAGEIKDDPTGLFYLFARYYDPETGRFVSLDPELGETGTPQTLNRYVYCGNNPLIRTDPTGRFWNIIIGAIVGAIVGGITAALTGGDIGEVLTGVVAGALSGAIAGATFGMAAWAGNVLAKGVTSSLGKLAVAGGAKLAGSFVGGFYSTVANDYMTEGKVDVSNAFAGGISSMFLWGFDRGVSKIWKAVDPISKTPGLRKFHESLTKPLVSDKYLPWKGECLGGSLFSDNLANEGFRKVPNAWNFLFEGAKAMTKSLYIQNQVKAFAD